MSIEWWGLDYSCFIFWNRVRPIFKERIHAICRDIHSLLYENNQPFFQVRL